MQILHLLNAVGVDILCCLSDDDQRSQGMQQKLYIPTAKKICGIRFLVLKNCDGNLREKKLCEKCENDDDDKKLSSGRLPDDSLHCLPLHRPLQVCISSLIIIILIDYWSEKLFDRCYLYPPLQICVSSVIVIIE